MISKSKFIFFSALFMFGFFWLAPKSFAQLNLPIGLKATEVTQTSIKLNWRLVDGKVPGYRVYEYAGQSEWVFKAATVGDSAIITGLDDGKDYIFSVAVVDISGMEINKSEPLFVRTLKKPAVYRSLSLENEKIFAVVGREFSYDIDVEANPPAEFSLISGPDAMNVDSVAGVVNWTPLLGEEGEVTAIVRASNLEGYDDFKFTFTVYPKNTDLEPPESVKNTTTTQITSEGCVLVWEPAQDNVGVEGYLIKAQKIGRAHTIFTVANVVGATTTEFTINTFEPGSKYNLWVVAYDAAGNESDISGTVPLEIITLESTKLSNIELESAFAADSLFEATEESDAEEKTGYNVHILFANSNDTITKPEPEKIWERFINLLLEILNI